MMQAPTLQSFLEAFLGTHHRAVIDAAISESLSQIVETAGASDEPQTLDLERFEKLIVVLEQTMRPGALKEVICMRHMACGGNAVLLAKALQSMRTTLPMVKHASPQKAQPWR
jgi:hypothetical protein